MSNGNLDLLLGGRAYRLFQAELNKHLDSVRTLLAQEKEFSVDHCRQAGSSFHTIRGGAGFFGLHELASLAEELEQLLLFESDLALSNIAKIKDLISQVEKAVACMPAPTENNKQ